MKKIRFSFDIHKVTQTAVLFLKLAGGEMQYIKLIKLLYLADRETLNQLDHTISGDRYVSMKNGPVLSKVKDLMTEEDEKGDYWREYISAPQNYSVKILNDPGNDDLCEAEEDIIHSIHKEYGHIAAFKLADLTHVICDEWKAPKSNKEGPQAIPIEIEDILIALGKEGSIDRIRTDVQEEAVLNVLLN